MSLVRPMIRCGQDILILNNMKKISTKKKSKFALAASLICADISDLKGEITKLERGGIDYIHFDVMDNQFVPRFGLYPEMLKAVKRLTNIPVDVHLMVDDPEKAIPVFAEAGADYIVIHAEATSHLDHLVKMIRKSGSKPGIALNPSTSLSVLDYVLGDIDLVMLMAINPGILGHKLIPGMMQKISELKTKLKKYPDMLIEIDGGVSFESGREMLKRGANMLVCGTSAIFKPEGDVDVKIKEFKKLLSR